MKHDFLYFLAAVLFACLWPIGALGAEGHNSDQKQAGSESTPQPGSMIRATAIIPGSSMPIDFSANIRVGHRGQV